MCTVALEKAHYCRHQHQSSSVLLRLQTSIDFIFSSTRGNLCCHCVVFVCQFSCLLWSPALPLLPPSNMISGHLIKFWVNFVFRLLSIFKFFLLLLFCTFLFWWGGVFHTILSTFHILVKIFQPNFFSLLLFLTISGCFLPFWVLFKILATIFSTPQNNAFSAKLEIWEQSFSAKQRPTSFAHLFPCFFFRNTHRNLRWALICTSKLSG